MRTINEEEKKFVEEVGHVIVHNAIFHWSQPHHFQDHCVLTVFQQMRFVPHGHKGNSPMGSPLDVSPIMTLSLKYILLSCLFLSSLMDRMCFANNIHGFFFLRCPSHLEDIRLSLSVYGNLDFFSSQNSLFSYSFGIYLSFNDNYNIKLHPSQVY